MASPVVRGVDWAARGVTPETLADWRTWVRNPLRLGDEGMSLVAPACALLQIEFPERSGDEEIPDQPFAWTFRSCERYQQALPAFGPLLCRGVVYAEEIGCTIKGGCRCCKFMPVRLAVDFAQALNAFGAVVSILK